MAATDKSRQRDLSLHDSDAEAGLAESRGQYGDGYLKLALVRGTVVASIKAKGLVAHKLLLLESVSACEPLKAPTRPDVEPKQMFVAVDLAGAGIGEVVLVAQGSAARIEREGQSVPTDAAVVAIVDSVQIDGQTTFTKL